MSQNGNSVRGGSFRRAKWLELFRPPPGLIWPRPARRFERAQERYEDAMAAIERDCDKLDSREQIENERWNRGRDELADKLRKARR